MKHFRINNIHRKLRYLDSKRFLRKKSQFFYTSLTSQFSPQWYLTRGISPTGRIAVLDMKVLH